MAKIDQNTYVEPVSTTAIAEARTQQNRTYRSLLTNFSSNVEPSITAENIVLAGEAVNPPDGTLFHLANTLTSALYVHDERSSLFTKGATHPLSGTKFTRYGIQRAEATHAQLEGNAHLYEVGETVAVFDSSNARIYIAKQDSADIAVKFVDAGIPPTNGSVTNTMISLNSVSGITPDRANLVHSFNAGGTGQSNVTLELRSAYDHEVGSQNPAFALRGANVSLGFNWQNTSSRASLVFYGAGTGAGTGLKSGLRVLATNSSNLAPFAANLVLQSAKGAAATTAASNDVGPICPPGAIFIWAGSALPAGWLECDGSDVSQTTYAGLYAAIGTAFNDASTSGSNFKLPDFRDRFPLGKGTNNSTLGANTSGTLGVAASSSKITTDSGSASLTVATASVASSAKDSSTLSAATGVTAGGHTHTATVPSVTIRYIIKT